MGTFLSYSGPKPRSPATLDDGDGLLKDFKMSAPTAAVIGAGIAGVHAAYELAQLGFDVTVFEQNATIASGGSTRFALPFAGVGLLEPSLARMRLLDELLKGALATSCPDLIAREHWAHAVFQPGLYRWLSARRRGLASADEVLHSTDNLARLSVAVVSQLARRHPGLREFILAEGVPVHKVVRGPTGARVIRAQTAHASPIMVDPVCWTRALAEICSRKYRVKFALAERWESANTYLKYNVEVTRSIRTSVASPEAADSGRRFREHIFDVVVLATGAQTGALTAESHHFPILPLSGCAVALSRLAEPLASAVRQFFPENETARAPNALTQLSGPCSLYAYRLPPPDGGGCEEGTAAPDEGGQYYLTGLLSLNKIFETDRRAVVFKILSRLEAYLRVKCGMEVPFLEAQVELAEEAGKPAEADDRSRGRGIQVEEYTRGFTPDGVPLVDQSGGTFNMFVCAGFGDHAMDFAPGAAKILGNLIQSRAENLLEEDKAQLARRGPVHGVLPHSQRPQLEREMQLLLNGILPGKAGAGWRSLLNPLNWCFRKQAPAPGGGSEEELVHFNTNPFSTDRYARLIKKDFQNQPHYPPMAYVNAVEERLVRGAEPTIQYLTRWAIDLARKEATPELVRSIIFNFVYDYELDTVGQQIIPKLEEARLQLIREKESGRAQSMEMIEQSKTRNLEIERRARGPITRTTQSIPETQ